MKHIKTTSEAETAMRNMYKVATDMTPVRASDDNISSVNKILEYQRQIDLLTVEVSKEKGALMGVMQTHSELIDPDGKVIVTWKNGNVKETVDWNALVAELNIPPATVERFTTRKTGSRVFTVVD